MYGYVVMAMAVACAVSVLKPVQYLKPMQRGLLVLITALIAAVPIAGKLPFVVYCRGLLGDLSITTLLFLCFWTYSNITGQKFSKSSSCSALKVALGFSALFLYPMTLGVSIIDPYWLGYRPEILIIFTLGFGLLAVIDRCFFTVLIAASVLLAYSFRVMESTNFWDYLFDPIIAVYCLVCLPSACRQCYGAMQSKKVWATFLQPVNVKHPAANR